MAISQTTYSLNCNPYGWARAAVDKPSDAELQSAFTKLQKEAQRPLNLEERWISQHLEWLDPEGKQQQSNQHGHPPQNQSR